MLFSSLLFLFLFLPAVLALAWLLPLVARLAGRPNAWRGPSHALLLAASVFFYTWGEGWLVLVMLASTAVDFVCGLGIDGARRNGARGRRWLVASIATNLGLLGFFKYAGFGLENLRALAAAVGLESLAHSELPAIALPLGISFYTFQSMSYTIDVYRGLVPATRRWLDFACYVTLFPQLVAGPIVRYADVQTQLQDRVLTLDDVASGVLRFTTGLAKKVLIANTVAVPADAAFAVGVAELDTVTAWVGIACYTLQIYFDFSGYSDMAIGLGRMLGFRFAENFAHLHAARSIQDFWRRWHISLSTWFRDYLHVPLGGNRRGTARCYANLVLVFLLCGLWHGAAWNFVVWGVWHGAFLIVERAGLAAALARVPALVRHGYVLLAVLLGWVVFRADDLAHAAGYTAALAGAGAAERVTPDLVDPDVALFGAIGIVLSAPVVPAAIAWFGRATARGRVAGALLELVGAVARPLAVVVLLTSSAVVLAAGSPNPFIYFRF